MKLHSPKFEQRLRHGARRRIAANTALRRQWRRAPKRLTLQLGQGFGRVILSVWLFALVTNGHRLGVGPDGLLAIATLWYTGLALMFPTFVSANINGSGDNHALGTLPFAEPASFDWLWQQATRFGWWRAVEAAGFATVLVMTIGLAPGHLPAIAGFALLQWGLVPALGLAIHRMFPFRFWPLLGVVVALSPLGVGVLWRNLPDGLIESVLAAAKWCNVLLPAGWIGQAFREAVQPGWPGNWLFLVPVIALLTRYRPERVRMRAEFGHAEHALDLPPPEAFTEALIYNESDVNQLEMNGSAGHEDAIKEHIRGRAFLVPQPLVHRGEFIAALALRLLNARERLLFETFGEFPAGWTARWRNCWLLLAGLCLANLLFRQSEAWTILGNLIGGGILALMALPYAPGLPRAFSPYPAGQLQMPFHAGLPVSFFELGWMGIKIGLLRGLLAVPLAVVYGASAGWVFGRGAGVDASSVVLGIETALELVGLYLAIQPFKMVCHFSPNTADAGGFRWRSIIIVLVALSAALGILICGAALALTSHPAITAVVLAGATLASGFSYWIYGRLHNANRFDLLKAPTPSSFGG